MKPICGMWITLMLISVVVSFLLPEQWSGANALFGKWPTIMVIWLIVTLFFDWAIQSTGMRPTQAAVILAVSALLATGALPGILFYGWEVGAAGRNALIQFVFWYGGAIAYGKLSA